MTHYAVTECTYLAALAMLAAMWTVKVNASWGNSGDMSALALTPGVPPARKA